MARIRNAVDVVVERMCADASVADQLTFDRYPEDVKEIARRAVALEIDKAADECGSTADTALDEAVKAVGLHLGELRAHVDKFIALVPGTGDPATDAEVARSKMLAKLAELECAIAELEVAAEADAE